MKFTELVVIETRGRTKRFGDTLAVNGGERDATLKQGVGIYVSGHDFGKGDTVKIEETDHEGRTCGGCRCMGRR